MVLYLFKYNFLEIRMPKTVDIYVLVNKIGQGQFGDVFQGYSKVDGTDVAIKAMNRDRIKGTTLPIVGKFS